MPTNYTGTPGNISSLPLVISEPVDGDARNAASVSTPLSTLADAGQFAIQAAWWSALTCWQKIAAQPSAGVSNLVVGINNIMTVVVGGGVGNYSGDGGYTYTTPGTGVTGTGGRVALCGSGTVASTSSTGIFTSSNGTWTNQNATSMTDIVAKDSTPSVVVAVGSGGNVVTYTPGGGWVLQGNKLGGNAGVRVAYGAGLFVAGTTSGTNPIYTSPDGVTWTARTAAAFNAQVNSLAFGGGQFVAADTNGHVATSTDGITWTLRATISLGGIAAPNDLLYNGRVWLMCCSATNNAGAASMFASFDNAATWRQLTGISGYISVGGGGVTSNLTGAPFMVSAGNGIYLCGAMY